MADDTEAKVDWSRMLANATPAIAGVVFTIVLADSYNRLADHDRQLRDQGYTVERHAQYIVEHDQDSDRLYQRLGTVESRLVDLSVDARARPDPFTGQDGKALRELIDQVERRVDSLERCCDKVAP